MDIWIVYVLEQQTKCRPPHLALTLLGCDVVWTLTAFELHAIAFMSVVALCFHRHLIMLCSLDKAF